MKLKCILCVLLSAIIMFVSSTALTKEKTIPVQVQRVQYINTEVECYSDKLEFNRSVFTKDLHEVRDLAFTSGSGGLLFCAIVSRVVKEGQ